MPFHYVRLTSKHFNEQMEPATFVALFHRQAMIEAAGPLLPYSNILLRLEAVAGEVEVPELYAKVIGPLAESGNRYSIHCTSAPPGVRARSFSPRTGSARYGRPPPQVMTASPRDFWVGCDYRHLAEPLRSCHPAPFYIIW